MRMFSRRVFLAVFITQTQLFCQLLLFLSNIFHISYAPHVILLLNWPSSRDLSCPNMSRSKITPTTEIGAYISTIAYTPSMLQMSTAPFILKFPLVKWISKTFYKESSISLKKEKFQKPHILINNDLRFCLIYRISKKAKLRSVFLPIPLPISSNSSILTQPICWVLFTTMKTGIILRSLTRNWTISPQLMNSWLLIASFFLEVLSQWQITILK